MIHTYSVSLSLSQQPTTTPFLSSSSSSTHPMMKLSPPPPLRLRHPPSLAPFSPNRFKGVRRRSWGRWVSEIRIPHCREKIWLGSYTTAEQAARAYDIASILLRGPLCSAFLNFPDSTSLFTTNEQFAALTARGIASPRTIQATAAAAANSVRAWGAAEAARHESPKHKIIDNVQQNSSDLDDEQGIRGTSVADSLDCAGSQGVAEPAIASCAPESGHHSCWIEDVLSLIMSPKLEKAPSSSSTIQQGTSSLCRCNGMVSISPRPLVPSSCSSSSSAIAHNSCSKTTRPEHLIQMLLDDFQDPLEGLTRDGFTAISAAVTTRKRFDITETMASQTCEVDGTQLWSHVC